MTESIALGITFTIPTRGETNWDATQKVAMQAISSHDHTGSGNGKKIATSALDLSADMTFSKSTFAIKADTSDGSDTKKIVIGAGGAADTTRTAFLQLEGNEAANPGRAELSCGNVASGQILIRTIGTQAINFYTNSVARWSINTSGYLQGVASQPRIVGDAGDASRLFLNGGSDASTTNGALIELGGNSSGNPGLAALKSGNVAGAIAIIEGSGTVGVVSLRSNGNQVLDIPANTKHLQIFQTTAPAGTPSASGFLFVESGALKYKGSSGTTTTIAVA